MDMKRCGGGGMYLWATKMKDRDRKGVEFLN